MGCCLNCNKPTDVGEDFCCEECEQEFTGNEDEEDEVYFPGKVE